MIDVVYDKKSYLLPEEYNELSGKQLIQIAAVLCGNDDALVKQLKALRILLQYNFFSFFSLPSHVKRPCFLLRILFLNVTDLPNNSCHAITGFMGLQAIGII